VISNKNGAMTGWVTGCPPDYNMEGMEVMRRFYM
jgi:hypothetical protein